jgi:hypothetical protein
MESQFLFAHRILSSGGLVLLVIALFSVQSCKDFGGNQPPNDETTSFGVNGKIALRLAVDGEYLYACAGAWGLWRKGIREGGCKYLGLADSQQLGYGHVGVRDVDPRGDDLLVAYNGSSLQRHPDSTYAVWRSTNGGGLWFRSDSGIPQSRKYPQEFDILNSIRRSPDDPLIVMGVAGPARFISTDGGWSWSMYGVRGAAIGNDRIAWNPWKRGEAWIFGDNGIFEPYQFKVTDFGLTLVDRVDFCALGFCGDGIVFEVAFDWDSADTILAFTSGGVFKTGNNGLSWQRGPDVFPLNQALIVLADPAREKTYVIATSARVYLSTDGLLSFTQIADYGAEAVYSLAIDAGTNTLFVGTGSDVRQIALPIQ